MTDQPLRLLILGAHPDDAEFHSGGLAAIYTKLGHVVKMVSVTNGAAGHHEMLPSELAQRRSQEAAASGKIIGAAYDVWQFPDGQLQPTLEVREAIIREIRTFAPDLVVTHRTCDYHPDHRAVGQAVQDASYLVTVPLVVPDVPILKKDPVVAYMTDPFTKPTSLEPHAVIDIDPYLDTVVQMIAQHVSQVFEFLPYNKGTFENVPSDPEARFAWLRETFLQYSSWRSEKHRSELIATYGEQRGQEIRCMEAYEISEYASALDETRKDLLFPRSID
jgi:LmbE family N-acetylglucosaminyl deacetylase